MFELFRALCSGSCARSGTDGTAPPPQSHSRPDSKGASFLDALSLKPSVVDDGELLFPRQGQVRPNRSSAPRAKSGRWSQRSQYTGADFQDLPNPAGAGALRHWPSEGGRGSGVYGSWQRPPIRKRRGVRRDRPPPGRSERPREDLVEAPREAPREARPARRGVDREIYRLQQSHNYLSIPKAAFARVVKDIQSSFAEEPLRFSTEALELLQAATEEYLMYLFADGYLATAHRRRVTLSSEDVRLVRRLRQRGPRLADTSPGSSVGSIHLTVRFVYVADMTAMRAMGANRCWKAWYRSLAIAFACSVQSLVYVAPASRGSGLPKPKAAGSKEGVFPTAPALMQDMLIAASPVTPKLKHVLTPGHIRARAPSAELEKPHVRLVALGLGLGSALARKAVRQSCSASSANRRAAVRVALKAGEAEDPLLAEAKAAAEAAKLQLEAAKLRAEADEMRQATAVAQRKARAVRLLGSEDVPGIGLPELMARLQETEGVSLTGEQALALAAALGLSEEPYFFRFEELNSETFDTKLRAIEAEARKAEQAQAEEQRRREEAARAQAAQAPSQAGSTSGTSAPQEAQEDRSLGPRLLGSLAYILPVTEAFKLMLPLIQVFPPLGIVFGPITLLTVLLNFAPFVPLLLFVLFIVLAQSKDNVPRFLRFNLEQAVLLDMALTIPSFILSTMQFSGAGEAVLVGGAFVFALVFGISVYAVLCNLDGKDPDGVPFISNITKNVVDRQTFFDESPNEEAQPLSPPRAASSAVAQGAPGAEATRLAVCTVEDRRATGFFLEEWFVDPTGDFENWRSRGPDAVSVKCRAAETRAEDITCLECVSHVSDLPFTSHPRDALLPSERRRQATLDALASVMQARLVSPWRDGSMELCRRAAAGENAFCKSAAVMGNAMLNAAVSQLISRRPAVHSTLWRPASQPHADNFQFSESLRKAFRNVVIIVTTPQSSPSAMSVADFDLIMAKTGSLKRRFQDADGTQIELSGQELEQSGSQEGDAQKKTDEFAKAIAQEHMHEVPDSHKPFVGAQPKLLKMPRIADGDESYRATRVACQAITTAIKEADGVVLVFAQDASVSGDCKSLLEHCSDSKDVIQKAKVLVAPATDWQHTIPNTQSKFGPVPRAAEGDKLLIYIGTPGKYATMCLRSDHGQFDAAYQADRLIVLCKGVCMLPIGTQEQNILGVDETEVLKAVCHTLKERGPVAWGLGDHTKTTFLQKAYGYPQALPAPSKLTFGKERVGGFKCLADYVKFTNSVKLANPETIVKNYYDTGLTVSVLMATVVSEGTSLLTDADGLAMLRDASIGHIMSKLNQVITVEELAKKKSVYNFYIGDGACRLNGGTELTLHLMEGKSANSLTNVFLFNNKAWAIEDNLVATKEQEHVLYNTQFYDVIAEHQKICICETEQDLREILIYLSDKTVKFLAGEAKPGMHMVVVRGLKMNLPPVLGDIEPIKKSKEMQFMRDVLGTFAKGCESRVPLYGCSAFEYIQYLHIFLEQMPEGKHYQYICGRTDIQAAHMMGFHQPEGKCVLFINDVYGVNSMGESLRFVLSGFGGRQVLVVVWHPSVLKVIDNFHLHRPPMVWPSLGPQLARYYVRKESDAFFADFEGESRSTERVKKAIEAKTPLVMVNVMPQQECNYVQLDARIKVKD
ncbi:HHT1 [Symbiodinium sp. KB8]|nr:HHT1 [Symbiodinium sp. KB8]